MTESESASESVSGPGLALRSGPSPGIHPLHMLRCVVQPALAALPQQMRGRNAVALVLGTAIAESVCGHYLRQVGASSDEPVGQGLGPWQIEDRTARDIVERWAHGPAHYEAEQAIWKVSARGMSPISSMNWTDQLTWNLPMGAMICRLIYWTRTPSPLPDAEDVDGQANMWKDIYNSPIGDGTPAHYKEGYRLAIAPLIEVGAL